MTKNPKRPTPTDALPEEPFPLDEESALAEPMASDGADAGEGEGEGEAAESVVLLAESDLAGLAGGDAPREEADETLPEVAEEGRGAAEPIDIARSAAIVESLMLISAQPLSYDRIGKILGGFTRADVRAVVDALKARYSPASSGIVVEEINRAIQFRTNPANQEYVRKMFDVKPVRFSRAALETLAIIAYRQPITRQEMEEIRGVDCAGALKTLMERRLVRVMGKKNVAGKPFIFGTTREFMEVFGLGTMSDLPSLREIEDYLSSKSEEPQLPELPFPMDEKREAAELADALDQSRRNAETLDEMRGASGVAAEDVLEEAAMSRVGDLDDGIDELAEIEAAESEDSELSDETDPPRAGEGEPNGD
ncbi:MAG TPA: SMC-Scp complex subunit ScpB [Candidatus Deferrimicrobiaceae bacterium]|jgi:segregation and condensation protein B